MSPLPVRRVHFAGQAEGAGQPSGPAFAVDWQRRRPEFAMAANAVSLMMPHVEPYVVRSVRGVLDDLDPELATEARAYAAQESAHHAQHRRFNHHVVARYPVLEHLDRALHRTFGFIESRGGTQFHLAYAAGAETIAYAIARWVADHRRTLLDGASGPAAELFIWHLAEEVEHKAVAYDVFQALGGNRRRFLMGMLASLATLATFTLLGTLAMLVSSGRILDPRSWVRLAWWGTTFAFELLPTMAVALVGSHHPNDLADPEFFEVWLRAFDREHGGGEPVVPPLSAAGFPR